MPKAPMNDQELTEFKNKILDVAAQVIREEGFHQLSMRKIAARLNMAAPSLYYYFTNKDDINIAIRMRAGTLLYEHLAAAYEPGQDLKTNARNMLRAYVEFGLYKPHYYEVMFDSTAPKRSDYEGSSLESAAKAELESSLRSLALLGQFVQEFIQAGYPVPDDIETVQLMLWSQLHGIISLHNNKLLSEIGCPGEDVVIKVVDLFFKVILSYIGEDFS